MLNNLMARLCVRMEELKDREDGQGLIEYALLASLIAIVSIIFLRWVGFDVSAVFDAVENALGTDGTTAPTAPTT